MTKFVCAYIDLKHLEDGARALVPDFGHNDASDTCTPSGATFDTQWSVKKGVRQATGVKIEVEPPHVFATPHFLHGTSVFAAGRTALELARIELLRAGLPKDALDQLDVEHVSFESVTVTYLLRLASSAETTSVSVALCRYARLLGLNIQYDHATNAIMYGKGSQSRPDSLGSSVSLLPEEPVLTLVARPAQKVIRLDVRLEENYLCAHGWKILGSWRNAYVENRYEAVFNDTVRKLFRLDEELHQHNEPRPEIQAHLNIFETEVLQGYIAGNDPMTLIRTAPAMSEAKKKKVLNDLRKSLFDKSGVDIKIPWRNLRLLRSHLLDRKLKYHGDLQPDAKHVPTLFCKENWPHLLGNLRKTYVETKPNTKP